MSTSLVAVFWAVWVVGTLFCAWKAITALADHKTEAAKPADPERTPGTDRALQDRLELIFSLRHPDEVGPDDAGCDRLRNALREHRKEEGT